MAGGFPGYELEEPGLGHHGDVGVRGFEQPEVGERDRNPVKVEGYRGNLRVTELQQSVRQPELRHGPLQPPPEGGVVAVGDQVLGRQLLQRHPRARAEAMAEWQRDDDLLLP